MSSQSLLAMNLDELLAFSLIESNKHLKIKESARRFSIELCNILKDRQYKDKIEILRSVLSIIKFCNINLYVSHVSKYIYYCDKINNLLFNANSNIKNMDKNTPLKRIKKEFYLLVMELDNIKFEEEINREFIYPREKKSIQQLKIEDSDNIKQINSYFEKLPKEESNLFEFFGI